MTAPVPGLGVQPGAQAGEIPSIWLRVGARLFDQLLLAVPTLILTLSFVDLSDPDMVDLRDLPQWLTILTAVLPLVYEFVLTAWRGATLGKSLVGVKVYNAPDGGRIRPYQAGLRVLVPAFGSLLALGVPSEGWASTLAFLTPLVYASTMWDRRRRGLHDKAAGTIVLRSR